MPAPDPADKEGLDQFQGSPTAHRGGYGSTSRKLDMALRMARKGGTLQAGEGALIVQHFEGVLRDLEDRLATALDTITALEGALYGSDTEAA